MDLLKGQKNMDLLKGQIVELTEDEVEKLSQQFADLVNPQMVNNTVNIIHGSVVFNNNEKQRLSTEPTKPTKPSILPCRYVNTDLGCRRGEFCRFSHAQPAHPAHPTRGKAKARPKKAGKSKRPARVPQKNFEEWRSWSSHELANILHVKNIEEFCRVYDPDLIQFLDERVLKEDFGVPPFFLKDAMRVVKGIQEIEDQN